MCAFVNADVGTETIENLREAGVKRLILMRCAGFNNVDLDKARECGIQVYRVPGQFRSSGRDAMALALIANRRMHKAYMKVRENDFSLSGLLGINFYQKTAGIIGTGKIGGNGQNLPRVRNESNRV